GALIVRRGIPALPGQGPGIEPPVHALVPPFYDNVLAKTNRFEAFRLPPFPETVADQAADRVHGLHFVRAVDLERDFRSLAGRQHHHAHDALGVHLAAVARDLHVALEFRRELRQLGRGPRVQPQLVDDLNLALVHTPGRPRRAARLRSRPKSPS